MDTDPQPIQFNIRLIFVVMTVICVWSAIAPVVPALAVVVCGIAGCVFYMRGVARDHGGAIAIGVLLIVLSVCALPMLPGW
jgi:hypothetical protein